MNMAPTSSRSGKTAPCFVPGGVIDLSSPCIDHVNFRHMADKLARQKRFTGEVDSISVAQHCVMGAEALLAESRDPVLAALFVLHDGHEWLFGDLARSVHDRILAELPDFERIWAAIKAEWDEVIYPAAELPAPSTWTRAQREAIDAMDRRMAGVEILAIYGPRAHKSLSVLERRTPKLQGSLTPWPTERAAERFLATLSRFTGRTFR